MALSSERIEDIATLAGRRFAAGDGVAAVARVVRQAHPDISVTGTLASLMAGEPHRTEDRFALFLVDGSGHCWTITGTPTAATGVVIAEQDEDDA